jgi:hypothetical protein
MPLGSSLSGDETSTYWVIQDGSFTETLARIRSWPPQSVLYCMIAWVAKEIGGAHEIVLRLPSVVATAVAVWLLFRLGTVLFDRLTAIIATIVFLCLQPVSYAAVDARPYALALASLIGATLQLVYWLGQGRRINGILYAVLASFTLYMQPLFGVVLLVHAGYALYKVRYDGKASARGLIEIGAVMILLTMPLIPELLATTKMSRAVPASLVRPHVLDLLQVLTGPVAGFALLLGLCPFLGRGDLGFRQVSAKRDTFLFLVSLAVLPTLLFFAMSSILPNNVFIPRYLLSTAPAISLLFGWAIGSVEPVQARRFIVVILVLVSWAGFGALTRLWPKHGSQDWRSAMKAVSGIAAERSGIPVLFQSAFGESMDPARFSEIQLLAPIGFYPPGTSELIPIPNRLSEDALKYVDRVTRLKLEPCDRFLVVLCEQGAGYGGWLEVRMGDRGFQSRRIGDFGEVSVTIFERNKTTAGR